MVPSSERFWFLNEEVRAVGRKSPGPGASSFSARSSSSSIRELKRPSPRAPSPDGATTPAPFASMAAFAMTHAFSALATSPVMEDTVASAASACGVASRYSRSISACAAQAPRASNAAHFVLTRYSNDAASGATPAPRIASKHRSALTPSACRTQLRSSVLNVRTFGATVEPSAQSVSMSSIASSRQPLCAKPLTNTVYVTSLGSTFSASMFSQTRLAFSSSPTRTHALSMFVWLYTFRSRPSHSRTRLNASSANPSCLSLPKSRIRRLKNLTSRTATARRKSVCASRARLRFALCARAMPSSIAASAPCEIGSRSRSRCGVSR